MSFHTPPHKHAGDEGKPGQTMYPEINPDHIKHKLRVACGLPVGHLSSLDNIPSPTGRLTKSKPELQEFPKPWSPSPVAAALRKERTDGNRMIETFAGANACKLWWWPTDNGR